jgi:ADP-heptose:LPS heptosyltransferase
MGKRYNIVLHCTKNYLQNSINLIKLLLKFNNNLNIYLYTINFITTINLPNVTVIKIKNDLISNNINFKNNLNDPHDKNVILSILFKSDIILDSLENQKLDECIYIDSDILPNNNMNKLFKYFKEIKNYPLIQNGLFNYYINDGRGNPFVNNGFDKTKILEYPIMEKFSIPIENRTYYSVTSIIVYNKKCLDFIKEYDKINKMISKWSVNDIKYYFPFLDETTFNILLWKYKYNDRLPILQMNVDNLENIKEFYWSKYETEKNITNFVKIPDKNNKKNILFFHGLKGDLSNESIDFIDNIFNFDYSLEDNKIWVQSLLNYEYEHTIIIQDLENIKYIKKEKFKNNIKYWFSPNNEIKNYNKIIVKIVDNDRVISEYTWNNNNKKIGISINATLGDLLNTTPIIRHLSNIYDSKITLFTDSSIDEFNNNPYIEEMLPYNYDKKNYLNFKLDSHKIDNIQRHIRKMNMVDYYSSSLGFMLEPDDKTIDFFPNEWKSDIIDLNDDYICINPIVTWPSRTWDIKNWNELISLLKDIKIVVIGKSVNYNENDKKNFFKLTGDNILDLTDKTTLSDTYHIINNSKLFITPDSGLLHIAGSTNTEIVFLTSSISPFYRTPFRKGYQKYKMTIIGGECKLYCASNLKYSIQFDLKHFPYAQNCLENFSEFKCHPKSIDVYNILKIKKLI